MRSIIAVAGVLAVSACAQAPDVISLDDIRDARGELPGFDTVINCSKAPRYIFDKHGEIVDTIHPIRHPSCAAKEAREAALQRAAALRGPVNEATDDDVPVTLPVVVVPEPTVVPDPTKPTDPPVQPPVVLPDEPKCNDPDSCHTHPDHDPLRHDNDTELRDIHGIVLS